MQPECILLIYKIFITSIISTRKIGVEHLRVYINAYNLLTISPDMKDYDPENTSGSGYNYPLNKVINFGVNLTF